MIRNGNDNDSDNDEDNNTYEASAIKFNTVIKDNDDDYGTAIDDDDADRFVTCHPLFSCFAFSH